MLYDDVDGRPLDSKLVKAARQEEMQYIKSIPVYEEADLEECMRAAGKPPIFTRWVDHDKGKEGAVDIRCRLVSSDFRVKGEISRRFIRINASLGSQEDPFRHGGSKDEEC